METSIFFMEEGFYLIFHWPWAIMSLLVFSILYFINFAIWLVAMFFVEEGDKLDNLVVLNGLYKLTGGEGNVSSIVGPKID